MRPSRLPARAAALALLACAAAGLAPAAHAATGFVILPPGSNDPTRLPRELQRPPICTEKPKYTRPAYRKGLEGTTIIRTTVGPDGRIRVMTVYRPSGDTLLHRDLDAEVTLALSTCTWDVVSPASFDAPVELDVIYQWVKAEHADDL